MAKENTRSTGVVSNINDEKGCGFIEHDDGTDNLYFHPSDIKSEDYRPLRVDQAVGFMDASENDKTKAGDVTGPNGDPVDRVGGGDAGGCGVLGSSELDGGGGTGHIDEECDKEASGDGGGGMGGGGCCYCGNPGHLTRECDREVFGAGGGSMRGEYCYYCGDPEHLASECDNEYEIIDGRVACGYCGVFGHIGSECDVYTGPYSVFARRTAAAKSGHNM